MLMKTGYTNKLLIDWAIQNEIKCLNNAKYYLIFIAN